MSIAAASSARRVGRPRRCPLDVLVRVVELREAGALLTEICDQLNADHIPTPGGGLRWWPSHVHRLLGTYDAQLLAEGYEVDGQRVLRSRQPSSLSSTTSWKLAIASSTARTSPSAAVSTSVTDPSA
jgi:hypothetical protein